MLTGTGQNINWITVQFMPSKEYVEMEGKDQGCILYKTQFEKFILILLGKASI